MDQSQPVVATSDKQNAFRRVGMGMTIGKYGVSVVPTTHPEIFAVEVASRLSKTAKNKRSNKRIEKKRSKHALRSNSFVTQEIKEGIKITTYWFLVDHLEAISIILSQIEKEGGLKELHKTGLQGYPNALDLNTLLP
jgi:hypothetical protein